MSFHIRKVRNGRIKLFGRWWKPRTDANCLNGISFAFGDYLPHEKEFICLWGTASMFYYNDLDNDLDDDLGSILWDHNCSLLSDFEGAKPLGHQRSGSFMMIEKDKESVACRSKGFEFWDRQDETE